MRDKKFANCNGMINVVTFPCYFRITEIFQVFHNMEAIRGLHTLERELVQTGA